MDNDNRLAMLVISLHFACPLDFPFALAAVVEVGLRGEGFFLLADFTGCLRTTSKSEICSCRIGPLVSIVNPSWVIGLRRPSLISPMQMDSTAPWNAMQMWMDHMSGLALPLAWRDEKPQKQVDGKRYLRWWNGDVPQVIEAVGAATDGELGRALEHPGYRPGE